MLLLTDRHTPRGHSLGCRSSDGWGARCPVRPSLPAPPTPAWGRGSISATKSAPGGAPQSSPRAPRPRFAVGSRLPGEGRLTVSTRARPPEASLLLPPQTQHRPAPAGRTPPSHPTCPRSSWAGREPPAATRPGRLECPTHPPGPTFVINTLITDTTPILQTVPPDFFVFIPSLTMTNAWVTLLGFFRVALGTDHQGCSPGQ